MTAPPHFFDSASTTPCLPEAAELLRRFATDAYGHPSSTHALGQASARAIHEARHFFAELFHINPEQVIFTGSGTESDNLAIYGLALPALAGAHSHPARILASTTEHSAVKKTVLSLSDLGVDARLIPVDSQGQPDLERMTELLLPATLLVSLHQVNNITGAVLPVEDLAHKVKQQVPGALFHTDAVQAFGKISVPTTDSPVDLVSISGHKINGPKGIGALIVLNPDLLKSRRLKPMIWGGGQEGGWRSGTQNAGLIAGFRLAAERAINRMSLSYQHASKLRDRLRELLKDVSIVRWNSPSSSIPHIVSISAPGFPSGPLSRLLEERGFLVATGSACSSTKPEPDPTLEAMGLDSAVSTSALRISFSEMISVENVDSLVDALSQSLETMRRLGFGGRN